MKGYRSKLNFHYNFHLSLISTEQIAIFMEEIFMNIHLARSNDLEAISECVNTAYSMYISRLGKKPASMVTNYSELIANGVVHVVLEKEELKGLIVLIPKTNYLLLKNLAVHPRFQGQGIGRKLIEFAIEYAETRNLEEVRLYTNELMSENLEYYPKFGFVETDRRTEDGFNRVYMSKRL